ncbi:MAG: hypothetical protein ABIH67_01105 [Candidatus Uhrbacteria bacterium]
MPKPYISITDFANRSQVMKMMDVFVASGCLQVKRMLGVGIMISRKTLNGLSSKWTDVWPRHDQIAGIFIDHPLAFNTLHYADYDGIDVYNNLVVATRLGGVHMKALQLDMIWPDAGALYEYRQKYSDIQIILQVNSRSLEQVDNDPLKLHATLEKYRVFLDYVLLDLSMGCGKGMQSEILLPMVKLIAEERDDLGIVVAGGLGPETMDLVAPIVAEHPQISFCAQGQLRASGNALDPIDWDRAAEYLKQAIILLLTQR